jgi:hypothetical protein
MLADLRSFVRKVVGFLLFLIALILFAGCVRSFPHGSTAYLAGYLIGGLVLPLILGYVGIKMIFRGDLATTPSQEPTTSLR